MEQDQNLVNRQMMAILKAQRREGMAPDVLGREWSRLPEAEFGGM